MTSASSSGENRIAIPQPSGLSGDAPLRDLSHDRLHRKPFAEYLARSILGVEPSNGFVFALTGPWGSGKTTVLNFTECFLKSDEDKDLVIVHFNPWWVSGSDRLLQHFFRQFRSAVRRSKAMVFVKAASKWLDTLDEFAGAVEVIPGADIATKPTRFAIRAAKAVSGTDADVHALRQKIDEELRKFPGRIVVVIDDLDRLQHEEIRIVFRLVKAVANFPRTLYLLAYDEAVVIEALGDGDTQYGKQYLDKIVQLPLALPALDRPSLRALLFEGLDAALAETPDHLFDQTEWGNLYWDSIDPFVTTPRHVARLLNLVRATYPPV